VLVRWWTANCPFCSASAPALRKFDKDYGAKGSWSSGCTTTKTKARSIARLSGYREALRLHISDCVRSDWRTLKSWLHGVDTGWTSVTFVLDKRASCGTSTRRPIHRGRRGAREAHVLIEKLIAEN